MNNKKPVLISIDTEGPCGNDPVKHLIYGETTSGMHAGIEKLMDIFDENNVKGLFFVDIAEAWDCGFDKIANVLKCIKKRGHDTGVHIHPEHIADRKRRYLWQYSIEEQRNIISKCTEFYENCLGEKPLSFRAGRYGLNNDTFQILSELSYTYEMSGFYGNRYCKIEPQITCNKVVEYKGLVEVPVTVYKSFKCCTYERYDKMDVSLDRGEFIRLANRMIFDKSIDIVSLFAHSFSLLDWRTCYDSPKFMKNEAKKIEFMIKYMKQVGYEFISETSLKTFVSNSFDQTKDMTDYSDGFITWLYFARRAFRVIKARVENNV